VLEEEVIAAEDGGGYDYIGIYGPVGELEFAGEDFAPAFGFAAGVLVSYKDGGLDFFEELLEGIVWMTAEDEVYTPLGGIRFYVSEALLHEAVVAEVGVGVVGNDGEEDYDGEAEKVGSIDRDVERRVLDDAHGALHPVDDAFAVRAGWAAAADEDAWVVSELGEGLRKRGAGHASSYCLCAR